MRFLPSNRHVLCIKKQEERRKLHRSAHTLCGLAWLHPKRTPVEVSNLLLLWFRKIPRSVQQVRVVYVNLVSYNTTHEWSPGFPLLLLPWTTGGFKWLSLRAREGNKKTKRKNSGLNLEPGFSSSFSLFYCFWSRFRSTVPVGR